MSGFKQCLRLLWLTLLHSGGTSARPTLRRIGVITVYIPLLLLAQACHWVGYLLDEVFFRKYREVKIRAPFFILGLPRSGTTLLHRMLALDTENFTTMRLWEMLLAPSITERKLLTALAALDRVLGGLGHTLLRAVDRRFFAGGKKLHNISLFQPEEDDLVLLPVFSSAFLLLPFPFPQALWHLVRFDHMTPEVEKRRIMSYYRRCIQRHLYVHGPEKHFLSKNPSFSSRIDALGEYFPDARIICNVRDPLSAVPSMLSFMHYTWACFDNDPRGYEFRDRLLEMAEHWYRHSIERLAGWPESRCAVVSYDELTADPYGTTVDLYARLGLEITPAFDARLREACARSQAYRSEHTYSLEQYGLTPADIMDRFGLVVTEADREPVLSSAGQ